jgi:serine/threonine protein phosphatase PrpC
VFLAYEPDEGVGLFLVTDGVSISTYGTGDQASTCVRLAAVDTWARLMKAGADAGMGKRPKLPLPGEPRRALLRSLLDQANAAIGKKVEASGHRFSGPPEGVMAATTVAVLVEDNHATLMSIGDSRIYLVRDGHIASLMVDHDLGTQLIRLGRSPTEARATPSSGALIRCVGEFDVNTDGTLRPVPLQPDFREMRLLPGDALLLCSDGLPDYGGYDLEHAEDRIREVMESAPGARWAAFELMVLANRGGGGDNISCIVLRVVAPEDGGAS